MWERECEKRKEGFASQCVGWANEGWGEEERKEIGGVLGASWGGARDCALNFE